MGLFRRTQTVEKPPQRTVVAAAMPVSGPGVRQVMRAREFKSTEAWQLEAMRYFHITGELRSPLRFIANAVSQAGIHAADIDADLDNVVGPTDDETAQRAAAMVLGGGEKRAGALRMLALHWQCVGESWVIVRAGRSGKPDEWVIVPGQKLKAKGDRWQYTDPMTGMETMLGTQDRLFRLWDPDPFDPAKADSAVRAALPELGEAETATLNIAARLQSRIGSHGIAAIAEELDFPTGDFDNMAEAFMDYFASAVEANLKNPGQASAQSPVFFTAPGELIANGGAFAFFDLMTQFDASVVELRRDALDRVAATLDMPKEVAAGTQGEANHWSAWQVEESTYKIYIEPLLTAIGDAITENWFRPALVAMGKKPEEAERFALAWDTSAIVARPDATENLRDLHDRLLISDEYMLAENGIPEDARPDDEEYTRRFLEGAVKVAPTLLADPAVRDALGIAVDVSPVAAGVDAEVGAGGELEAPEPEPAPVVRALPGTQGDRPEPDDVPEGLAAAAVVALRALERAGGRLLTREHRGQYADVPKWELHTHIAPEDPAALAAECLAEDFLTASAVPQYARPLRQYVTDRLRLGQPHDVRLLKAYMEIR